MAQVTDRTIGANPTGFDMRTELNNIISALESDNSGSSEPLNTVAYMKWLDTSNATYYYYKERNHDNTSWVTLFRYTVATKVMEVVSNGVVLQDSALVHKTGDETITGVKTFSSSPIVPVPTLANQVISMGNIIEKTGAGIGYGTGSGGTVTQLTSKSTAVTLNKPCGRIITASDALVAGGSVVFIMNNSTYGSEDNVIVSTHSTSYSIEAKTGNVGVIYFILKNISGSSLSDAVSIKFTIIKGATA